MATRQRQKPKSTSQSTLQKIKPTDGNNQAKLIPIDYLCLVLILAPLFGDPSGKQIAVFWNENRKVLREIFSDFPEFDISEDTAKKILMTIIPWDLLNLDGYSHWLESLFKANSKFMEAKKKSRRSIPQPINIREGGFPYYCLFETPTGIAIGRKVISRKKPYRSERAFKYFVDLSNTVVTWNVKKLESNPLSFDPGPISTLIYCGADYVMPVNRKNSQIFEEVRESFKKYTHGVKEILEVNENKDGEEFMRLIHIVPTTYLSKETKDRLKSLKDGCILKATFKNGNRSSGQERYFISSLPFSYSNIEALGARAIWEYWDVKDVLDEVMIVDCHFDMGIGKNAAYIRSCADLKILANRIENSLNTKYLEHLDNATEKRKINNKRDFICGLLSEIDEYYGEVIENYEERMLEAESDYSNPDDDWPF